MYVIKRDGRQEPVFFDKITARISKLCWNLNIDPILISQKVIQGVYKGVTTSELDELAAETAVSFTSQHPHYGELAARITVSDLHKRTPKQFGQVADLLFHCKSKEKPAPLLSREVYDFIQKHLEELNSAIIYDRDNKLDYFGLKTLSRSYLLKVDDKIVERPQHMFMRVACGLHYQDDNTDATLESYHMMSNKWFTHASPTLFNAGTPKPQLSSCFLLTMKEDSIKGIYDTLTDCAQISKLAGGIGLDVHDIRATGSYIRGTNGHSNGLVPMLRVFNNTARYVDQGGGKRKGSFAIYLEPWHADIFAFLDLKKNNGVEENRARDLFYALWIPDLFMKRVENDLIWSLFCPNEAPGLATVYGEKFEQLYMEYESKELYKQQIKARTLWQAILETQVETGVPYMLYKDTCNRKSNQQNLGTIRCSNLCTEIIEFTSPDETAVCNLASIALNMFATQHAYDFQQLFEVVKVIVRNLNKIIDINYYPIPEAKKSNLKHRPIGIGVQGLANAFIAMRMPFDSKEAAQLNKDIFETIYFAACTESNALAQKYGTYESYQGSPMSQGLFQFDLWKEKEDNKTTPSVLWDWSTLRENIQKYGMRNSLLVAPMPTATTSQILGNNECFEPITSNIYVRRTLAGEFTVVSKQLQKDLLDLGIWTNELKDKIIAHHGSVQNIKDIPETLRAIYKTAFEIKSKVIIDMAADRGRYICQSQSLNIHMPDITVGKLTSMHFYAWKKGLKTGMSTHTHNALHTRHTFRFVLFFGMGCFVFTKRGR